VASFNALGILIPILIALYLDPKLPSHVLYPHRSYPVGLYYYLLLAVPVALAAAVSLAKGLRSPFSLLWSCVFLVVAGVFAAWRFPPETPHWGIIEGTFSYALLSFLTVYFARLRDDHRYLNHLALPYPGRLERLKATVSTFQLLTVYAGAGYLAFVVTLMYIMWNVGPLIIRCHSRSHPPPIECAGELSPEVLSFACSGIPRVRITLNAIPRSALMVGGFLRASTGRHERSTRCRRCISALR
jgi:hypothetical protein